MPDERLQNGENGIRVYPTVTERVAVLEERARRAIEERDEMKHAIEHVQQDMRKTNELILQKLTELDRSIAPLITAAAVASQQQVVQRNYALDVRIASIGAACIVGFGLVSTKLDQLVSAHHWLGL